MSIKRLLQTFSLFGLLASPMAQQLADSIDFEIVVRDFQAIHPDFETFETYNPNTSCTRVKDGDLVVSKRDSLGNPQTTIVFSSTDPASSNYRNAVGNELTYTTKMVQNSLVGSNPNDPWTMKPQLTDGKCASSHLDQWFTDVNGVNKSVSMQLVLRRNPATNQYEVNYNYLNRGGFSSGFYPLDLYDQSVTFGKQNDQNFCNLTKAGSAAQCSQWSRSVANLGPLFNPYQGTAYSEYASLLPNILDDAAFARYPWGKSKMHNYSFTVEGVAYIEYNDDPAEKFFFDGDDDMWVFIDNELAVDLGGVHGAMVMPPPAFDIYKWGQDRGWKKGEKHVLKFFNAERQTNGSNFILKASFRSPPSKFAALAVQAAAVSGKGTKKEVIVYLNSPIYPDDIKAVNEGKILQPFVVKTNGNVFKSFNPSKVEEVAFDNTTTIEERSLGTKYKLTFTNESERPYPGDSISVNDRASTPTGDSVSIRNFVGKATTEKSFKEFAASEGVVENLINDVPQNVEKTPFTGVQEISSYLEKNPDDTKVGGEIVFTGMTYGDTSKNGVYFYKDLTPLQTVYDGMGGDAGFVNKQRCYMDEKNPAISNCLILPHLEVNGPFQVKANVYDQNGQFIKTYQVSVTADMLLKAQKKGGTAQLNGKELVQNSTVVANFALYPTDSKGRLLGTGVYMVKFDVAYERSTIPVFGDDQGTREGQGVQTANRFSKFVKIGYVRPSGNK